MMVVPEMEEMEPPCPTNKTPKTSTLSFEDLIRMVKAQASGPYQFPHAWRQAQELQKNTMEQCSIWREEQFQRAVETRKVKLKRW